MAYTPQVQIAPQFSQYMQGRSAPFAYAGGTQQPSTLGGNFGFGNMYGNMYGNMMQSGQQAGVAPGVFGMPSRFSMQTQAQQTPVQQVANATGQQPNINLSDQAQQQSFLDEYKKLYMNQLAAKDPRYKQLADASGTAAARWRNSTSINRAGPPILDMPSLRNLESQNKQAQSAYDAYFNPMWDAQQSQIQSLFSGQLTPQMLLQGMTRGLLR